MRPVKKRATPADALSYGVEEAAERIGLGETTFKELIATGQIKTFKVGRRRLVSRRALEAFVAKMERAA